MDADGWVEVEVDSVEVFRDVANGAAAAVISLAVVRFVAGSFDVPAEAAVFAFFFGGSLVPFVSRRWKNFSAAEYVSLPNPLSRPFCFMKR